MPSGAEFLHSVDDHEPDCVVLDLHMPGMSGFDVQGALAVAHAGVPVVVITGHDTPESRTRALRLGAKAYLCKPVDDEALLSAIGTAIDRASAWTLNDGAMGSCRRATETTEQQPCA